MKPCLHRTPIILAAAFVLGLAACSKTESGNPAAESRSATESVPTQTADSVEAIKAERAENLDAARSSPAMSASAPRLDSPGIPATNSTSVPRIETTTVTQDQMVRALKEALAKGVQHAVASLGRSDGFLNDAGVRIPLPETLRTVENAARAAGQGRLADEFVLSMNRAAEKAVPEAVGVLGESIQQMTVADATDILRGPDNAATEYFRRTCTTNLQARLLPIVKAATEQVGVTQSYKQLTGNLNLGGLRNLGRLGAGTASQDVLDVDAYVTRKTLDGLFVKMAEQEKLIRENPLARTTDLLQKVFGTIGNK